MYICIRTSRESLNWKKEKANNSRKTWWIAFVLRNSNVYLEKKEEEEEEKIWRNGWGSLWRAHGTSRTPCGFSDRMTHSAVKVSEEREREREAWPCITGSVRRAYIGGATCGHPRHPVPRGSDQEIFFILIELLIVLILSLSLFVGLSFFFTRTDPSYEATYVDIR